MSNLKHMIVVGAAILAVGLPTTDLAQELPPGEIVSVGRNIYRVRITGELIDVADRRAQKQASEFCATLKRTVVVQGITFDMGYGYTLTWACLPPERARISH